RRHGFRSGEIHGDMDQSNRLAELDRFKGGEINILVASDVAARGLDIKGVSHVFNFDTPWHPDDYVHRSGRTGRAGAKGRAFTFVAPEDAEAIANVEKLTGTEIPVFDISNSSTEGKAQPPKRERADREKPKRESRTREERRPEPEQRRKPAKAESPRELEGVAEPGDWNGPVPSFLSLSAL